MVFLIQITVAMLSLILGYFLLHYPIKAIGLQIKFYKRINWNMSPISIVKEIYSTKRMGLIVIIATVMCIATIILQLFC